MFIWLTDADNNRVQRAVNPAHIAYMERGDHGTTLFLTGGFQVAVGETMEEVDAKARGQQAIPAQAVVTKGRG
jgi:hypothetical protein